jgi:type VI secretion system protein ImpM
MSVSPTLQLRNPSSFYFGKICSRGDFVKSATGTKVIALIDQWVAQGMEMLLSTPDWKTCYDNTGPIDFLFLGTRKKHVISGCLIPSNDASSRRFPFIAAIMFEVDESMDFLPLSPLVLERHLNHQRALVHHASRTHDAADTLTTLNDTPFETEAPKSKLADSYRNYLTNTSIAGLQNVLSSGDVRTPLRQMILAVGYLLQPLLTNYSSPPHKALAFPLPRDQTQRALAKALWLDLTTLFLARTDFELSVFSGMHFGTPKLIVSFNGATPAAFHTLFDEYAAADYLIDISQSEWVEDFAASDSAIFKLSSYLNHGDLSLQQMVEAFRQGFSG